MILPRLVLSNFTTHRVRVALTLAAVALSVSLVVAVTSGYTSAEAVANQYLGQIMGSTDVQLTRQGDPHDTIPQAIVAELRRDPAVKSAIGRLETESGLIDQKGQPLPGRTAQVIGVERPADTEVGSLALEAGAWFDTADGDLVVLDQVAATKLGAKVGDTITLPGVEKRLSLKVVGIVHKPGILAEAVQTLYVPLKTLQTFLGKPDAVNRVMVNLQSSSQDAAFKAHWETRLAQIDPMIKMKSARDSRKDMEKDLQGVHLLSYFGGAVSLLAATFIVFSALSMGVTERSRTLAMLRAIGAYRMQLAMMVLIEGVLLAAAGAGIGTPLGLFWVKLLAWWRSDFFTAGVIVSKGGILFGAGGATLAAIFASLLPAWNATRVDPLAAMTAQSAPPSARTPFVAAAVGLLLLCVDPLLIFLPAVPRAGKYYAHFAVGLPTQMIGFFLLAPLFVRTIEILFGGAVAVLLGVQPRLLRQQLSGGLWRAAGTGAALMVGLATLIVMQTQGRSMLAGWKLPDRFPDIFIWAPAGLTLEQSKTVANVKGIKPGDFMPIAIAKPGLGGDNPFAMVGAAFLPDATMFFGIEPDQALRMMELEFRDENGNRPSPAEQKRLTAYAAAKLKEGRQLIITDEFRQLKGLKVGDKLRLKTAKAGEVDYTVCGVVWSPGIDVIVSMFDMGRQFDQRTAASVFGSIDDARRDFGVETFYVFAANLDAPVGREDLIKSMTEQIDRNPTTLPLEKRGTMDLLRKLVGQMGLKAGDVRHIKYSIQNGFKRLLNLLSSVAFASLAVAALGVTNTIMASIRSRRWQFGVLRSIGVTRSQLLRLVLAESLLLGLVGCALGLACGFSLSVNANGLSKFMLGYMVPLQPPWGVIGIGLGVVMGVAAVASIWPAVSVARSEPLELLQAGRAAS